MTAYTADDFKNARFATHPDGRIAARLIDGKPFCPSWILQAVGGVAHRSDHVMAQEGWVPVQEARPLTAEGLTEDGIKRAQVAWLEQARSEGMPSAALVRLMFDAALIEPPSRPEGAEGVETALLDADEAGFFNIAPRAIQDLADWLAAERGVRVVTEERS